MKIINGHGTIDKTTGKYIHSPLDKEDDMRLIKEFHAKVKERIVNITKRKADVYNRPSYNKSLKDRAGSILLLPDVNLNTPNFLTNRQPMVFIETGINENGYDKTIKRHYVIKFQLSGKKRYKFQKHWEDCEIFSRYCLADTLEGCLNKFAQALATDFTYFLNVRVKNNMPWNSITFQD